MSSALLKHCLECSERYQAFDAERLPVWRPENITAIRHGHESGGFMKAIEVAEATTDGQASSSKDWNDGFLEGKRAVILELKKFAGVA